MTVNYEGRLINGAVFDSSWERGKPETFSLLRVIKGWREAVLLMRPGETWEFVIPANLAYGPKSPGPIPPDSALLFKIELVAVQANTAAP